MFKTHLKRMLLFMAVAGLLGFLYASSQPTIYEANVSITVGSPQVGLDASLPPELQNSIASSVRNDLDSDVGILKSQKIFRDGLIQASTVLEKPSLAQPSTLGALYPMFEVAVPDALNQYAPTAQRVANVRVRAFKPEDAAEIANQVGYAFSRYRRERSRTAMGEAQTELKRLLATAQAKSTKLQQAYRQTLNDAQAADLGAKAQSLTATLEGLKQQRDTVATSLAAKRAEITNLESQLAGTSKTVTSSTSTIPDTRVDLLKSQVASAQSEYETLRTQFLDDAQPVIQARQRLTALNDRLRSEEARARSVQGAQGIGQNPQYLQIQGELTSARAEATSLAESIQGIDASINKRLSENLAAPADVVRLQQISRDREIADLQVRQYSLALANYDNNMANTKLVSLLQTVTEEDARVVGPEVRRWVIISIFAGALLGLAYSFAIESLRLPVHTSWQLAELTALPVSAAIPTIPKPLERRHLGAIREGTFKPIESFRYMAFSLLARDPAPKTVMFTGVGAEVGSGTAAAEFAIAVARTGSRTILIDFDLRNPQLSTLFGFTGRTGVSDVLGATVLPGQSIDLLMTTEHENLTILPAGSSTDAGIADFQTLRLRGLLEDLSNRADLVVISCPSVDVYSDAARLAQYIDEVCLVISAKTTSYRAIPMAQEIMEKAGAKSMSIVLTNASPNDEPFGTRVSDSLVNA